VTPESRHDFKIQRLEQRAAADDAGADVFLDLAEAAFQKGYYYGGGETWFARAREQAEAAIARFGGSPRAYNIAANACYGLGRLDDAERAYRDAIGADPTDALAHVGLGNLHKQRGNTARAIDAFTRATELDPDLWQAHYNLGGALHGDARERDWKHADETMERAIYHLVTALRLQPFPSFVGDIYKDLGELFLHTRQHKHARRFFTKLTQHPEYGALAHYYLGLTHFSMGRYTAAVQHYHEFLAREPDSPLVWSKLALAWLELGDWENATAACNHALASAPDDLLARFSLACVELDQRQWDRAEARLGKLLEDAPDYFPAWVELVRAHWSRGDFGWLFESLRREITTFEDDAGFDGGRQYYKGTRGRTRRRIDVLLQQIHEMGIDAFPSLAEIVEDIRTDSLRFQIWEQLYELSRQHRVERVIDQLHDADVHFGRKLGRTVLLLSQFVPEDAILDGFHVGEDALRRRAREAKAPLDDITSYIEALDVARAQLREYQAYLLLALATKATPVAEDFLLDQLGSEHRELNASAAIALLFYGNEQAIAWLEAEASKLPEPAAARLRDLMRMGADRSQADEKIIRLDAGARDRPRARPRTEPREACSLCGRTRAQADRLMSGNRLYLCNLCVSYVHQNRAELQVPDREDHICSFCSASVFEVQAMHAAKDLLLCNRCLDTCVSLLAREEVERFLRAF
jgi:tetratricopeptide (TPR) repeat protein